MNKQMLVQLGLAILVPVVFSCCMPDQWEGQEGISIGIGQSGKPTYVEAFLNMSWDAKSKKVYLSGDIDVNGQAAHHDIVQDYSAGKMYVVLKGKCYVNSIGAFPGTCSPSGLQPLSTYIGAGQSLMVDIYNQPTADGGMLSYAMQKAGCIPIFQYVRSASSVEYINWYGITAGIKNPAVFNIPTACQGVKKISPMKPEHKFLVL